MLIMPVTRPLACLALAAGTLAGPGLAALAPDHGTPFYLEQTETLTGGASHSYVLARNADGAVARIENGSAAVRDIFFADGRTVSVFDDLKVKVTWPKGTRRQGVSDDATPDCNVESLDALGQPTDPTLGLESVLGEAVVVSEAKMGGFTIITWRAPRLACEELYYRSEKADADGTRTVVAELKTTQLLFSDPDPRLFTVNPGFPEIPLPDRLGAMAGEIGLPLPEDERERLLGNTPKKKTK